MDRMTLILSITLPQTLVESLPDCYAELKQLISVQTQYNFYKKKNGGAILLTISNHKIVTLSQDKVTIL
jgi:hypothetical protein